MRIMNPSTGELIREVEEDGQNSIAEKFARAKKAGLAWAARPLPERLQTIERFRDLVAQESDALAKTLTLEMGKPITQSKAELSGLLGRIDFFIEHVARELEPELVLKTETLEERISHEPLGVVANISAWNYPYYVGSNVFVPALLTGNAVLYKPSEFATLTGLEIARLLHEAAVPEDVFSVVVGSAEAGEALLAQAVDGVFFTGSHRTGQHIAQVVAPRLCKLQLELGGKDPVYVAADAPPEVAATAVADGAFYNTGQSCCAVERIYVHEAIFDAFVEHFVKTVEGFKIGDPLDSETYIGPLARREAQLEHLAAQVSDAKAKGATVLRGGARLERPGFYFAPTVLVDVDHSMLVMTQETFGPLVGVMKVGSDEEALSAMNNTEYGLTAAVYTPLRERAERLLSKLDVGSAYWNCCDRVSPRLPWTGRRYSGIGCTLSTYGIETFVVPKAWHLRSS
jgi:acyl-CoA reductase-like NAD-dependent aldehyde dehydrogenase